MEKIYFECLSRISASYSNFLDSDTIFSPFPQVAFVKGTVPWDFLPLFLSLTVWSLVKELCITLFRLCGDSRHKSINFWPWIPRGVNIVCQINLNVLALFCTRTSIKFFWFSFPVKRGLHYIIKQGADSGYSSFKSSFSMTGTHHVHSCWVWLSLVLKTLLDRSCASLGLEIIRWTRRFHLPHGELKKIQFIIIKGFIEYAEIDFEHSLNTRRETRHQRMYTSDIRVSPPLHFP